VVDHDRADEPDVEHILEEQIDDRDAEDPERDAQGREPGVVRIQTSAAKWVAANSL